MAFTETSREQCIGYRRSRNFAPYCSRIARKMPVKGSPPPQRKQLKRRPLGSDDRGAYLGDDRDFATRFDYVHFNSVKGSLVEHRAQGREAWQGEQAGN